MGWKEEMSMVEQVFVLAGGNDKVVEKVVMDENVHYIHMIFGQNEGLPLHNANSNVYMTVVRGNLTIALDEQDAHRYAGGTLLVIPFGTRMNVGNRDEDTLELIVVKAPAPKG
jgi:quercetin dioxygenase-like cupin family protein